MESNATTMPRRPYSARTEYFACREEAEALLARGYSIRMTYERMQEQGRVTCSYSAFCDYVRGKGKRLHSRKQGKQEAPSPIRQRPDGPRIISSSREAFPDPRTMNIEDAI